MASLTFRCVLHLHYFVIDTIPLSPFLSPSDPSMRVRSARYYSEWVHLIRHAWNQDNRSGNLEIRVFFSCLTAAHLLTRPVGEQVGRGGEKNSKQVEWPECGNLHSTRIDTRHTKKYRSIRTERRKGMSSTRPPTDVRDPGSDMKPSSCLETISWRR